MDYRGPEHFSLPGHSSRLEGLKQMARMQPGIIPGQRLGHIPDGPPTPTAPGEKPPWQHYGDWFVATSKDYGIKDGKRDIMVQVQLLKTLPFGEPQLRVWEIGEQILHTVPNPDGPGTLADRSDAREILARLTSGQGDSNCKINSDGSIEFINGKEFCFYKAQPFSDPETPTPQALVPSHRAPETNSKTNDLVTPESLAISLAVLGSAAGMAFLALRRRFSGPHFGPSAPSLAPRTPSVPTQPANPIRPQIRKGVEEPQRPPGSMKISNQEINRVFDGIDRNLEPDNSQIVPFRVVLGRDGLDIKCDIVGHPENLDRLLGKKPVNGFILAEKTGNPDGHFILHFIKFANSKEG
ncbi:MAG: hypothetical protein UV61_C0021G0007 [Candidatus Gottesmanbacteria bacterium GW2011_GWB1_43_11]|uniref:Uncharacterized protein n=1 Tax=Candidatus Gottesmanbacteria bacterium GW2011_GWB1_43_11 TaxID=1618446 RepID=A0A0G1EQ04_9BACT|nr:MAG: hypothetical protein UV17_C0023G0002 [Candidatus Gottesmanbacteria bacterium GW2011_GWA1_42_26]KKS80863.1 MAG: hypothetical protein UV55_C0027G0003 [Candidatus Gottesmanbacteria bacterium GW2011_GWC1_43_10]KKS85091.1 MAG: hypothetical protein UV61_C0021G0007 [Candidatus Gottesmanbacteria bacterium GW2011_GWB1_43_11]OGG07651.1 MAG: hypothetical protein A2699_06170 [Candidatus Gottesmanbacteria bacterium RIFCSPHIGHO2_01_FULL_43_15]HCM38286.1 hypothetical protein [Patescibacteria group bac